MDDFITRLKLQAKKCDFRDDRESNERVLEQFIAGIRHMELQKELLSTAQDFTTKQDLERDRTFEASIAHMRQLAEAQGTNVNAMRTFPIRKYHNCGSNHQNDTRDQCLAYGTICNNCGKPNHWGKVCRLTKQRRSGDRQQKRQFIPQQQSMTRRGHNGRQKGTVHSISGQSTECMDEHF